MKNRIVIGTLLALATPAFAQTRMDMPEGSKEVSVALTVVNAPRAEGSAARETFIAPRFSVQWANGVFINMNQLGLRLSDQPDMDYGVLAVPRFSRATILPGSAETKRSFTPEFGGYLNYRLAHGMLLTSQMLYGGSVDHRGLRIRLGGQFWWPVAEHHAGGVIALTELANRSALQANFAVAPGQATPTLRAHAVDGGVHSTVLGAHWRWDLTHKYTLASSLEWRRLHGSAASSPRVEKTKAAIAAVTLIYSF